MRRGYFVITRNGFQAIERDDRMADVLEYVMWCEYVLGASTYIMYARS